MDGRGYKLAIGILFPLFIVAVLVVAWLTRASWTSMFGSQQSAQEWIGQFGALAPLVFIAVQIFQVVVFVVPGEVVQIAGGYLFGVVPGLVYSLVGIGIGSAIDFFIARALGRAFVIGVFGEERVAAFDHVSESSRARTGFFLLFVIPGLPKDVLVYVAGISTLAFPSFLFVTMAGRLPGILGSVIIGHSASKDQWVTSAIILGVAVVLFALGVFFRARLHQWIERLLERRRGRHGTPPEGPRSGKTGDVE